MLSQVAIPLGPERARIVGQVEGVNHLTALPAAVTRRLRPSAWVCTMRHLTQPRAGSVDRGDVERQRGSTSDGAGRLELRDDPRNLPRLTASNQLERLS